MACPFPKSNRMYEDYTLRRRRVQRPSNRPKTRTINIILATILVLLLAILFRTQKTNRIPKTISPLASETTAIQEKPSLIAKLSSLVKGAHTKDNTSEPSHDELLNQIKSLIADKHGLYSVYIYDIQKQEGFGINETTIFRAASVNKIPVLAVLYYLAQRGEIDLDTRITLQASDIQDFGTGILRYQGLGNSYSLKTLANLLIQKSDNTANYVLGEKVIGYEKIQELLNDWGMTQTNMRNNKTSNQDMAQLMVKMYQGNITNPASTQEMMGLFVDTDFENRLPQKLPDDIKVYHKIGNEDGNIHDVGIVALENTSYYIGVLTNDITSVEEAENTIADISLKVYEYYTKHETN